MQKRQFMRLGATLLAAPAALPALAADKKAGGSGPVLLTVTGDIGNSNRGALDPALDQMMAKQKLSFDKAYTFDFAAVSALPSVEIHPTLEYDRRRHSLRGPLLSEVLRVCGAPAALQNCALRAVDGYAVLVSAADIAKYRFVVATHLDGKPIPLGGLGPLWAVYDADSFPEMTARPLPERFGQCPWGLYHIAVRKA
ncbi:putative pterin-binding protein [Herbaspirillum frisingense]|uniref:molybdopterin-dependent oxidoreductase n=1 Tax=Herbaspirillum frisingense TaxID=92645 RepID=UPI001F1581FC|nr:molybdopterin-dependent oxidoreductase [Herbaspirillum frisingense]UIN21437.1 molybdopterin-dependent oxidoreductase [Herbaspirillum frisingense]